MSIIPDRGGIFIVLYVDDMLIASNDIAKPNEVK